MREQATAYRFAVFELRVGSRELFCNDRPTGLPVKPASLLLYLIENRDRIVPQAELMDALWPDVSVSRSALTSAVKLARRALGERTDTPRFIRTYRGRGYRFAHPVDVVAEPPTHHPPLPVPSARQRRDVSVLVAVLHSKARPDALEDPEQWAAVIAQLQLVLQHVLDPMGTGGPAQLGERLVMVFGAEPAREDHAQAACRAALAIAEEVEPFLARLPGAFSIGLGVASGEAIVDTGADGVELRGRVLSDALQIAERAAGRVLVSANTARLIRGHLDLEPSPVPGVAPVSHALRGALGTRTRLDAAVSEGLSPFVGRGSDLARLDAALAEALAGRGSIFRVVGEAGIGKSRLCREFAARTRSRGIPVIAVHCLPHGPEVPLGDFHRFLAAQFGVRVGQPSDQIRAVVASQLSTCGMSSADDATLVADELSDGALGGDGPDRWRRRWVDFLRRFLAARSEVTPTALIVDDGHWLDAASEELFAEVAVVVQRTRTLLVVSHRPGYEASWSNVGDSHRMALRPLEEQAIHDLLRGLLGTEPADEHLVSLLASRSGGNPFFAEELARELIHGGGGEDADHIPANVRAVLGARIGRMTPPQQELLRAASVLGPDFPESLLRTVSGARVRTEDLHDLQRVELIELRSAYPETRWAFTHAMTQEAAYASLTGEDRRRLHKAALRALEDAAPEVVDARTPMLARHAELASDFAAAARWHQQAAHRVAGRHPGAALAHWGRVRAFADRIPDSDLAGEIGLRARVQSLDLLWRTGAPDDQVRSLMAEGLDWADRIGVPDWSAYLRQVSSSLTLYRLGDVPRARELAAEGLRAAIAGGNAAHALMARIRLFFAEVFAGEFARALQWWSEMRAEPPEAFGPASQLVGYDVESLVVGVGAYALFPTGRLAEAERVAEAGLALAEARESLEVIGYFSHARCESALARGDAERAGAIGQEMLENAERIGSALAMGLALTNLGRARALRQRWTEAVSAIERALAIVRSELVDRVREPEILAFLSEACLGGGDADRAEALAREAVADARALGSSRFEVDGLGMLVIAGTKLGRDRESLRALLESASALATRLTYRTAALRLRMARVLLADDDASAARELTALHRECRSMGAERYVASLSDTFGLPGRLQRSAT